MKVKEMKEALDKEFIGKNFECGLDHVSLYSVGGYIKNNFIPVQFRDNIEIDTDNKRHEVTLRLGYKTAAGWKQLPLMHAYVRRAKGNKHYSYFGDYCDWTVKGIDIIYCDYGKGLDLADIYEVAVEEAKKSISAANDYEAEVLDILRDLKAKTGADKYKLRGYIDYISRHWWSLENKIE
jgi:hypothetical protein